MMEKDCEACVFEDRVLIRVFRYLGTRKAARRLDFVDFNRFERAKP